jgi:hypothetical protein
MKEVIQVVLEDKLKDFVYEVTLSQCSVNAFPVPDGLMLSNKGRQVR